MTEAAVHDELRPLLFSIAYRMVGSVTDAEDIVQDAYLRYHRATRQAGAQVDSPKAYLSTVTTRLALDHLQSARVRREQYVGPWLPEPLLTDPDPDAAERVETADSLSVAFLVVLESLTPVERAVFLLHDVFDFSYAEVAGIVDKTEATAASSRRVPAAGSRTDGHASRARLANGPRSPIGSWQPAATATWTASSNCSPTTSSSTATAAATVTAYPTRCTAGTGSAGSWPASGSDSGPTRSRSWRPRSTGSPVRAASTRPAD